MDALIHVEAARPSTFRDLLVDFLRQYDPKAIHDVDTMLERADTLDDDEEQGEPLTFRQLEAALRRYAPLIADLEKKYSAPGYFSLPPSLNFRGRYFDPLASLYDPHLVPPCPRARPLDNVHKAQIFLPQAGTGAKEGYKSGEGPLASAYAAATALMGGAGAASTAAGGTGPRGGAGAGTWGSGTGQVRLGILHSEEVQRRDAQWKQGVLPPSLFEWLAAAQTVGPSVGLRTMFEERARVVCVVQQPRKSDEEQQTAAPVPFSSSSSSSSSSPRAPSVEEEAEFHRRRRENNLARVVGTVLAVDGGWNILLGDVEWAGGGYYTSSSSSSLPPSPSTPPPRRFGQILLAGDSIVSVRRLET